jgi:membrane peptidoglycan carboxypeptidase
VELRRIFKLNKYVGNIKPIWGIVMRKLIILVIITGLAIYLLAYNSATGTFDQSWIKASQRIMVAIRLDNLSEYLPVGGQEIVEINGKLAANLEENELMWIPLERIPQNLRFAIIAVEDIRFYQHGPVDFQGIARALLVNLTKGDFSEGGSTITQQLAKNLFLNGDKTMERKA